MGIVNRRNAALGWAIWKLGKRAARKKAKGAVSSGGRGTKTRAAIGAAAAAFFGVLAFWRRRSGSGG